MSTSSSITSGLVALGFGLALCVPAFAGEHKEVTIAMKDCPDAVLKTICAEAGKGRILEIEKEVRKGGATVFEAEIRRVDGVRIEVKVTPCGKLLGVEVEDDAGERDDDGKE